LLRASYGTGFRAPNIADIASYLSYAGNTSGSYACPFPGSVGCQPGNAQYDLVAGGNPSSGSTGLKPETSKQWTIGFRVDPSKEWSFGADLWHVGMNHQIMSSGIPEQLAFTNPSQYAGLFINPYTDPGAGYTTIAQIQSPYNLGQSQYQGIDWDVLFRDATSLGKLAVNWTGTLMTQQRYQLVPGGDWNTDLGAYGPDQKVVFRVKMNLVASLNSGNWLNTVAVHYVSGYHDQSYSAVTGVVYNTDANGQRTGSAINFAGLNVPSYTTLDWQTRYDFGDGLKLTGGIKNVLDTKPPLSLQTGGGGNQAGYDGSYANPLGRTFYLTVGKTF